MSKLNGSTRGRPLHIEPLLKRCSRMSADTWRSSTSTLTPVKQQAMTTNRVTLERLLLPTSKTANQDHHSRWCRVQGSSMSRRLTNLIFDQIAPTQMTPRFS